MLKLATTARKLKVTLLVDAAPFVRLGVPPDNAPARTQVIVAIGDHTVLADLATRSVRKAIKTLAEHGEENVALLIQGVLGRRPSGDVIEECGLVAQIKAPAALAESA
jgi:hypothetical protein